MRFGKLRAFFSALESSRSRRELSQMLVSERPDVVHVHNVYPLVSPAVLETCREHGVPVVMSVHNYRLICPNGLFFSRGAVCERCMGGKEYWSVLRNCEGNPGKSLGYALRTCHARRTGYFRRNVDVFAASTEFQRTKLVESGLPVNRIRVLPNTAPATDPDPSRDAVAGEYAAYVGRISVEKGLRVLTEAASACPEIAFRAAGSWGDRQEAPFAAPASFCFLGEIPHQQMADFLSRSRLLVFPSLCYEAFPMVIVEAMSAGRPVVASRIGGIPEIVEDGKTGLLFEPGNPMDLAEKVRYLWERPDLCREMGQAGRKKALEDYGEERHYERLLEIYETARSGARSLGPAVDVLGLPVHSTDMRTVVDLVTRWAEAGESRVVCAANVHMVMEARDDPGLLQGLRCADLSLPDGMPVAWAVRALGHKTDHLRGTNVTLAVCRRAATDDMPIGFYGNTEETLATLSLALQGRYPGLRVVLKHSPPFRDLTPEEDSALMNAIRSSGARILFVGLGCPKQERWMIAHRDQLDCVMLGVGAAFDFLAGVTPQAPVWMQRSGLEWIYRLASEPRRLWKRYLKHNPRFICLLALRWLRHCLRQRKA
jgi:exopolysaccharide biosynthesis WecB/TagA/CpsF family protein